MSKVQIQQQADFFNIAIDGMMFTADKCDREWLIGYGENTWKDAERLAKANGMSAAEFWAHYQPLLDDAVGW